MDKCGARNCLLHALLMISVPLELMTNLLHTCWTGFLAKLCVFDQRDADGRVVKRCDPCHCGERCWQLMQQILWSPHGHTAWEMGCPFWMLVCYLSAAVPYVSFSFVCFESTFYLFEAAEPYHPRSHELEASKISRGVRSFIRCWCFW